MVIGNVKNAIMLTFHIELNVIVVNFLRIKHGIERKYFLHILICQYQEGDEGFGRKGGKFKYVPNPDDWKCNLCGNFNFAKRERCNRCKEEKLKCTLENGLDLNKRIEK